MTTKALIPSLTNYTSGEKVIFQGCEFTLEIIEDDRRRLRIILVEESFRVYIGRHLPAAQRPTEIRSCLIRLFRKLARDAVTERLYYYREQLGVRFNEVRIKEQKTRWGSCSRKGNLNFNWKIVTAPPDIIDYIVVHELCHLVHLNHSRKFWDLVGTQIPDYRERKKWLRDNGSCLGL